MLVNDKEYQYKKVRALFTRFYVNEENNEVLIITRDMLKECVNNWAKGKHVPEYQKIKHDEYKEESWYIMPYYKPLTKEDKESWKQFQTLKKNWKRIYNEEDKPHLLDDAFYYNASQKFLHWLEGEESIQRSIKEAIEKIYIACANWSSTNLFDWQQRNLKVDNRGNLILLDILANPTDITKECEKKGIL